MFSIQLYCHHDIMLSFQWLYPNLNNNDHLGGKVRKVIFLEFKLLYAKRIENSVLDK